MSSVVLDPAILSSTLWSDRDSRDIFITALLLAEPYRIEVQTLSLTDQPDHLRFIIPPGWYGYVKQTHAGISKQAGIDIKDAVKAFALLASPDPYSRNSDYEGRRMVRVQSGYVILNFMKFRKSAGVMTTADRIAASEFNQPNINIGGSARRGISTAECPMCGVIGSLGRGYLRADQPASWFCNPRMGGCKQNFPIDYPAIASQLDARGRAVVFELAARNPGELESANKTRHRRAMATVESVFAKDSL